MKKIVTAQWLQDNMDNPDLVLLDASLPTKADGSLSEYANLTIPNARKFDLKSTFKDTSSDLPNTVPNPTYFEVECQKLGINQNSKIVVFDNFGIYSSPRVWWLFNLMGHKNIAVLDGGVPYWIDCGFDTREVGVDNLLDGIQKYEVGDFKVNFQPALLVKFDEVVKNCQAKKFILVDARSAGRFYGKMNEPRSHLKSGHIVNSVNLPYQRVLNGYKFKDKMALQTIFDDLCVTQHELVFSCGSGMTACIIMLACEIGFNSYKKVYDGSWTEWAELNKLTV